MNTAAQSSRWLRIISVAVLILIVLGIVLQRPISILYHRSAMAFYYQAGCGTSALDRVGDWVRAQRGLPSVARKQDPMALSLTAAHRQSLVNLGYFHKRTFPLSLSLSVTTKDYGDFREMLRTQAGGQPTFYPDEVPRTKSDGSLSHIDVVGLTVYATPSEMAGWERFVEKLSKQHD